MTKRNPPDILSGARAYLSGPMDFVTSREAEMKFGWRTRVSQFLKRMGVTVFDPWHKPDVFGLHEYGKETVESLDTIRQLWTFEDSPEGDKARATCAHKFWETLHIDLRMVDTSDFVIAYCPTNIYSVGTVHEIAVASLQHKPVLFVSPRVRFQAIDRLRDHLSQRNDQRALDLVAQLETEVPIKPNPDGIPSLWYLPLLGGHRFFDGFGFAQFSGEFQWGHGPLGDREQQTQLRRPLLPFLRALNERIPPKYDAARDAYIEDDDWLLWKRSRPGENS